MPSPAYAPVTLAEEPRPASFVSIRTLPRAEPKPSASQSRDASRADLGALRCEYPRRVGKVLAAHEAKRRSLANADLGHAVEESLCLGVASEVLLPDLSLGALLEDDERAPAHRGAGGALDGREADRHLEALPRGHVYESASGPGRLVAGDEDVVGRHDRSEMLGDEVRKAHGRVGEGHDGRLGRPAVPGWLRKL